MEIYDLRTADRQDPLGIDDAKPLFSWKIRGAGCFQQNYRIAVATDTKLLDEGKPDMWDSGVVSSGETLHVRYDGKPLADRTTYFWRVTVNGTCACAARFETSYLGKAMPAARWIGMPLAFAGGTDVVRLCFTVRGKPVRARLYLAALGCSRVYLNGRPVSDGYFDGALSVFCKRVPYRTYALMPDEGDNALCIELGYGFYGAKKCKAELILTYADGSEQTYSTLAGCVWTVARGRITENSVYGGEVCDERIGKDMYLPSFAPQTMRFGAAYCVDAPAGELRACTIPPMRVAETLVPVRTDGNTKISIDVGKNICGWLYLRVRGKRGAKVGIRYSELIRKDGSLDRANLRTANNRDLYILSGEGEEEYAPAFTYHGFRYAEITCEGEAEVLSVEAQRISTDLASGGTFRTSDVSLQKLHDMAALTEANNLNGVFTDCPQRDERLGWLNDMSSRVFESVCNFDMRAFLPNFTDMITHSQDERGAFGDTVPFFVGSTVADSVDAYPLLGWIAYKMYGDTDVLRRNYDGFCKWNERLAEYTHDGVVEWEIYGDWCPAYPYSKGGDGTHTAQTADKFVGAVSYIWNIRLTADIAAVLGKRADAARWQAEYERRKDAFFTRYLGDDGTLGNGSQTEYAMGMTVFAEEKELCALWAKRAAADIAARGYHTTCGNLGYRHLFYRLGEAGYADILYKMLVNPDYPGWGYMLANGATTVWERWEADVRTDMHSFDHPMFAAYDGFLYNHIAGIRTEQCENAFGTIVIEPCFIQGLSDAEGVLHTVRGDIRSAWRRENGHILLSVATPANTSLCVRAAGYDIEWNGKPYGEEKRLTNGVFSFILKERGVV